MPLTPSKSRATISSNISEMMHAGHKQSQAVAAALETARRSAKAFGGAASPSQPPWYVRSEARGMIHSGPLLGATPGRGDKIATSVPNGSHVIPSDITSHLGGGNSLNGAAVLGKMFHTGPLGMPMGGLHVAKPNFPKLPSMSKKGFAAGGHHHENVPVKLSDGEYLVDRNTVERIGGGDEEKGHRILDAWILKVRRHAIKTLKHLPPPSKD
jgi:hypothetical protein